MTRHDVLIDSINQRIYEAFLWGVRTGRQTAWNDNTASKMSQTILEMVEEYQSKPKRA
jgi:hypothetical protein